MKDPHPASLTDLASIPAAMPLMFNCSTAIRPNSATSVRATFCLDLSACFFAHAPAQFAIDRKTSVFRPYVKKQQDQGGRNNQYRQPEEEIGMAPADRVNE
jgi:hypothetical protein